MPISSTRFAFVIRASSDSSLPCWADTSIAGMPAAAADSRAARSASSSVCSTRVNSSSRALGSGSVTRPDVTPLAHAFLGVDDPQHVGDLGTHHRLGEVAERRDELRPVRRVGVAEMVGDLVQHDEFA